MSAIEACSFLLITVNVESALSIFAMFLFFFAIAVEESTFFSYNCIIKKFTNRYCSPFLG